MKQGLISHMAATRGIPVAKRRSVSDEDVDLRVGREQPRPVPATGFFACQLPLAVESWCPGRPHDPVSCHLTCKEGSAVFTQSGPIAAGLTNKYQSDTPTSTISSHITRPLFNFMHTDPSEGLAAAESILPKVTALCSWGKDANQFSKRSTSPSDSSPASPAKRRTSPTRWCEEQVHHRVLEV